MECAYSNTVCEILALKLPYILKGYGLISRDHPVYTNDNIKSHHKNQKSNRRYRYSCTTPLQDKSMKSTSVWRRVLVCGEEY